MSVPALRPYQDEAVKSLVTGTATYLAYEMGLGKSRIIVETAKKMDAKRVLVLCPQSVKLVWSAEFRKWWPTSPRVMVINQPTKAIDYAAPGVYVLNYDKLSSSNGRYDFVIDLVKGGRETPFDLMVLDEAHMLKSSGAKRTKAVFEALLPVVKRTIPLSGTPAPNHAGELYTVMKHLAPTKIEKSGGRVMSQIEFEDKFCQVVERKFGAARRPVRVIQGSKNLEDLKDRLKGFLIRKTKKECLTELPPLEFVTVPIAPAAEALHEIKSLSHMYRPGMSDEEVLRAFGTSDDHFARLRAALGYAKAQSAAWYLQDFLSENDVKILVWAHHQKVIDCITSNLADWGPVKIDGRDSQTDRAIAVEKFLTDPRNRVFVGNISAAGTGLTLIGDKFPCRDVFFVEASYTPGMNLQSACRVHRLGQRDGVLARFFMADGTIDDRVQEILARKTNELAQLF